MNERGSTSESLPARVVAAARTRGLRPVAGDLTRCAGRLAAGLPKTVRGSTGSFTFEGERHPYLYARYKRTWQTERAVEVPIVQRVVDRHAGARILEIGNVLSHYRPQRHEVVDRYERASGVINRDVFDLRDLGPYDLIVAISTIEHVGWDEEPRAPGRAVAAIGALEALLAPGGRLVLTLPAGYNPPLDSALRAGAVAFDRLAALRRVGRGTSWRQASPGEAWAAPYDFLLYCAGGVLIATVEGPRS